MHGKVKKSKIVSFIFLLILFVSLIGFFPLLLNIKLLNGIGYYNFEENNVLDYPEGSVGIKIEVNIVHWQGQICNGVVSIHTISSGNITVHGITHLEYSIMGNNAYYDQVDEIINPVTKTWNKNFRISLFKNTNVSCAGNGEISFSINSLEQTDVISFYLSYIIPINVNEIFYMWDLPLMWIYMFYIVLIFVVLSYVIRSFKSVKFDYLYTEEMRKSDEEFLNHLSQKQKNPEEIIHQNE